MQRIQKARARILALLLFVVTVPSQAATLNLGLFSYDNLFAGTNIFTIQNLTGTPFCGTPCLLSDFPVATSVMFTNLSLLVGIGGMTETLALVVGLAPGSLSPPEFEFDSSTQIQFATLTGLLDHTTLLLQDGTSVVAHGNAFGITLDPSSGSVLTEGVLGVLTVNVTPVPEPAVLISTGGGLLLLFGLRSRLVSRRGPLGKASLSHGS